MSKFKKQPIVILLGHYAILIYLFVLFVIYPLYVDNGYYNIDRAKYEFLRSATGIGLIVMFVCCLIQLLMKRVPPQLLSSFSITDICMAAYMLANVISLLFAYNRDVALWGQTGWYMGEIVTISFGFVYFLVTRFCMGHKCIIPMILAASSVVFGLGILNRFGIWPVPIKIEYEYSYLSTLGNLGWYSSFVAVIAPLGVGLYIISSRRHTGQSGLDGISSRRHIGQILLTLYVFIVFVTGISQGGDSIFIFFAVLFLGTFLISSLYADGLKHWLEMFIMWCLAGQLVHLIRTIWPESYGYDSENFCGRFNSGFMSLWIMIPFALVYIVVVYRQIKVQGLLARLMRFVALGVIVALLAWFVIALLYSNHIGIDRSKEELSLLGRAFYIDQYWGGARGTTMNIGLNIWLEQGLVGKLIGIGPDCFACYIADSSHYSALVSQMFGDSILTNAHNEFLTNLVNIGMIGVASYYGILISYIYRCFKLWKRDMRVVAVALCLICYTGYNMLNYAQLLNYPFYIVLIALGEMWLKHIEGRKALS